MDLANSNGIVDYYFCSSKDRIISLNFPLSEQETTRFNFSVVESVVLAVSTQTGKCYYWETSNKEEVPFRPLLQDEHFYTQCCGTELFYILLTQTGEIFVHLFEDETLYQSNTIEEMDVKEIIRIISDEPFSQRNYKRHEVKTKPLQNKEKFDQIACGLHHAVLLTNFGNVFYLDLRSLQLVSQLDYTIMSVVSIDSPLLGSKDEEQEVSQGQDSLVPKCIEGIRDIVKVSCGFYHTLFLSKDGRVFAFGNNEYGNLGTNDFCSRFFPVQIMDNDVRNIFSGEDYSLLWTSSHVLGSGHNLAALTNNVAEIDPILPTPLYFPNQIFPEQVVLTKEKDATILDSLHRLLYISAEQVTTLVVNVQQIFQGFGSGIVIEVCQQPVDSEVGVSRVRIGSVVETQESSFQCAVDCIKQSLHEGSEEMLHKRKEIERWMEELQHCTSHSEALCKSKQIFGEIGNSFTEANLLNQSIEDINNSIDEWEENALPLEGVDVTDLKKEISFYKEQYNLLLNKIDTYGNIYKEFINRVSLIGEDGKKDVMRQNAEISTIVTKAKLSLKEKLLTVDSIERSVGNVSASCNKPSPQMSSSTQDEYDGDTSFVSHFEDCSPISKQICKEESPCSATTVTNAPGGTNEFFESYLMSIEEKVKTHMLKVADIKSFVQQMQQKYQLLIKQQTDDIKLVLKKRMFKTAKESAGVIKEVYPLDVMSETIHEYNLMKKELSEMQSYLFTDTNRNDMNVEDFKTSVKNLVADNSKYEEERKLLQQELSKVKESFERQTQSQGLLKKQNEKLMKELQNSQQLIQKLEKEKANKKDAAESESKKLTECDLKIKQLEFDNSKLKEDCTKLQSSNQKITEEVNSYKQKMEIIQIEKEKKQKENGYLIVYKEKCKELELEIERLQKLKKSKKQEFAKELSQVNELREVNKEQREKITELLSSVKSFETENRILKGQVSNLQQDIEAAALQNNNLQNDNLKAFEDGLVLSKSLNEKSQELQLIRKERELLSSFIDAEIKDAQTQLLSNFKTFSTVLSDLYSIDSLRQTVTSEFNSQVEHINTVLSHFDVHGDSTITTTQQQVKHLVVAIREVLGFIITQSKLMVKRCGEMSDLVKDVSSQKEQFTSRFKVTLDKCNEYKQKCNEYCELIKRIHKRMEVFDRENKDRNTSKDDFSHLSIHKTAQEKDMNTLYAHLKIYENFFKHIFKLVEQELGAKLDANLNTPSNIDWLEEKSVELTYQRASLLKNSVQKLIDAFEHLKIEKENHIESLYSEFHQCSSMLKDYFYDEMEKE